MKRLGDALRRAGDLSNQADQSDQAARNLRDEARKLLESLSPEERRRLESLARELAESRRGPRGTPDPPPGLDNPPGPENSGALGGDPGAESGDGPGIRPGTGGGPHETARPGAEWRGDTTPIPLSPRPGADSPRHRVIAEWAGKGGERSSAGAPDGAPAGELRRAVEGAERAIEQQTIPSDRRDLVRRVFRRFAERSPAPPPAPPR